MRRSPTRRAIPIADLTREDFQLTEDDKPQTVTVFSHVALPVERANPPLSRATAVEPDVRSNRREFDGRVFVLMLDDLHTGFFAHRAPARRRDGVHPASHGRERCRRGRLLELGRRDRAQEFTGSRSLLLSRGQPASWGRSCRRQPSRLAEQDALLERSGQPSTGSRSGRHGAGLQGPPAASTRLRKVVRLPERRPRPPQVDRPLQRGHRHRHHAGQDQTVNMRIDSTQRTFAGRHPRRSCRRRSAPPGAPTSASTRSIRAVSSRSSRSKRLSARSGSTR